MNKTKTRKALNPAYRKHKPLRKEVNLFTDELLKCLVTIKSSEKRDEHEEHYKEPITTFLKNTFYQDNYINTKDRIDLAIYTGKDANSDVGVLLEVKRPSNKAEFLSETSLNRKALQELLLYYLRERIDVKNNNIKHLIATNGYEWFLFKSEDFYEYFYKNKALIKEYNTFIAGNKDSSKNELFYNEIAKKYIAEVENELPFVHLDFTKTKMKEFSDADLNTLYKIFSDVHLLGNSFGNDSNKLNNSFYNELLHIIGLEEVKQKGKKIIQRKSEKERDYASIMEDTIFILEDRDYLRNIRSVENGEDKAFNAGLELTLTWINRILFLKLLESQLLSYHKGAKEYRFLNTEFIDGYDQLNDLFFSALAKKFDERHPKYKERFQYIPYLNSSLFERNTLESEAFEISGLNNDELEIFSQTVLKDAKGKRLKGKLGTLDYLFQFLDAYDFATDGTEGIEDSNESKILINASVLGLIFEKINGYKEGSFYTPAYITMYMSKETLRRAVVQKFREKENDTIENFDDLSAYTHKHFKPADLRRFNEIINTLKIVDPAVGSGHFLVSALNEIISIKNDLGILVDEEGRPLPAEIIVENDELYVTDRFGKLLDYKPNDRESTKIQKTLFHEKQNIIENSLFGVDINPNSVKICRLRLWIELLKNTYYTEDNQLQTLPNIDINIKTGNSLIARFDLKDDLKDAFKGKESKHSFEDYRNAVAEYKNTNDKNRKQQVLEIIGEVKSNFKSSLDDRFKRNVQIAEGNYETERLRLENLKTFGEKISKKEKDRLKVLKQKAEKAANQKAEILNNSIYHNAFEWRFEFPEVLDKSGNYIGFDVVIGNPPYFQLQYSDYNIQNYFNKYSTYERTGDIYSLFFEKAFEILSNEGIMSYITSNRFCNTNYGKSTRALLSNYSFEILVNINEVNVFDEANVGTLISLIGKRKVNGNLFLSFQIKETSNLIKISSISEVTSVNTEQLFFKENQWIFESNNVLKLKNKIENNGIPLCQIDTIKINRGLTTGANSVFIVSREVGDSLIHKNIKNRDIVKPVLKGAEIKRYYVKTYSNYIILTKNGVNIKDYPEVYKYLKLHKKKLEQVYEAKHGKKKWYELRNCSYYDSFNKKKLIWTRLSKINSFAIAQDGEYSIDSTSFATGENLEYYSALLNSSLIFFYFKLGSVIWGKDGIKWFGEYFDKIPIKQISKEAQKPFIEKVNKILELKKQNPEADTSLLEKEIDLMVYQLYELTEEEIKIIENSVE